MEKARVYELAKELNTTSKRLMEKLAEINVHVKNHMSLLEPEELGALYKHIGIVKQSDKKDDPEERKPVMEAVHRVDTKKDVKKDGKSAPRIIRTTEIVIDSKNEANEPAKSDAPKNDVRGDVRGNAKQHQRHDVIKSTSNSGLRPGFVRDNGLDYKNFVKNDNRADASKEDAKQDMIREQKTTIKHETYQAQKAHDVHEIKHEPKIAEEPVQKPEVTTSEVQEPVSASPKENMIKLENHSNLAKQNEESTLEKVQVNPVENQQRPNSHQQESPNRQGDRPHGDRPQGGYNRQGDRPQGDRQQGGYNRQGDRPYGDRQQGQGGYNRQGDRPQGDRPQGGFNRQGDRPQGDRPQGGFNRQGDRPYGDRQQGGFNRQGDRPQGDRPQGGYNRQGDRPYGDRQQGGYNRQGDRPYGDRQQGGYNRQGDRPQGDRPQGGFNRQGDRPYGDRQQGGYNRQGDRPQGGFRSSARPLEIPKPELNDVQKEEIASQRNEIRREFQNKDTDKDIKREQKKEIPKGQLGGKNQRFKPNKVMLGDKKGVSEVLSEDFILEEFYSDDGVKRSRKVMKPKKEDKYIPPRAVLTSITIGETITVKDLAESLKKTSTDVIKKLMGLGLMATLNQEVDFDTAVIVADEFGVKVEKAVVVNEEDILFDENEEDNEQELETRPPVVVVMGHVDHGKTSLLDAIRKTNVMDSEAGGITQHIGAYMVRVDNRPITFLDTPGHEAFTAMRARGAQVTDIAILVVAADDGVMPQTIEAINHAKAANVSIIVAINKIDKPGADPDRVKQELTQYGIVAEEWGGDAIMVPVSAKQRMNIDQLLEMVLLTADVLELKANPGRQAKGTIIEAKLDKGRGPVATVLVQRGTLEVGDSVVTGTTVGRIRAMVDDKGNSVKKAGPSTPVEILGMPDVPEAGEIFYAITDEKVAKQLAEKRKQKQREQQLRATAKVSLEDLFTQIKEGKVKDLNIIVKADVQGSVEAVKQSIEKLSNEEVRVRIIHGGVGAITESDVTLAQVSNAIIIGFNVRPGSNVAEAAQNAGVEIKLYRVIYNAIEDIQAAMKGMLEPTFKEVIQGHVEARQIFKVSGVGTIAGCYVTDGKITRGAEVRVIRDSIVIHEGKLASLKRFKDDVKEVATGYECGLSIEKFNDIKESDIIEAFIMEEVKK